MFWMNGYLYFKDQPLHDAHPDSFFLLNIIIIKIKYIFKLSHDGFFGNHIPNLLINYSNLCHLGDPCVYCVVNGKICGSVFTRNLLN